MKNSRSATTSSSKEESWFSAALSFECSIEGDPDADRLSDLSIRVVRAASEEEALHKAEAFGQESAHSYRNADNEKVVWSFVEVLEVQELFDSELTDGVEVYSRLDWSFVKLSDD